jgi:hypothetical protein
VGLGERQPCCRRPHCPGAASCLEKSTPCLPVPAPASPTPDPSPHPTPTPQFFTIALEVPNGDMGLMDAVLEGMNAEVDESAEERKGGAGALGKMLLSAGDKALAVVCQVGGSGRRGRHGWGATMCGMPRVAKACVGGARDHSGAGLSLSGFQ